MMTTTDLTVVEQFNVDDRQTPRTQSADSRHSALPLDCRRNCLIRWNDTQLQDFDAADLDNKQSDSDLLRQRKLLS